MKPIDNCIPRREFVKQVALAGAGCIAWSTAAAGQAAPGATAPSRKGIPLGLDNFAVRAMEWKAPALIDYAASLKVDSLFISDLEAFESFEPKYLAGLRTKAADKGLNIHVGAWSICPTSTSFKKNWGTAEELLGLGIKVAAGVGSPVIRVILGRGDDRLTPGGIEARIQDTVKVCKALRSRAVDANVKIAVENHAGDMQSRELVSLIEQAGRDYVGANMDSGNAVWALEHPLSNLEVLGPYALTTSLRDTAVWESPKGATVQWTAMGAGNVDLKAYFQRFAELCKNVPVHIETISGFNRELPFLTEEFWKAWPQVKAQDFARFLALARSGTPRQPFSIPAGQDKKTADQAYQKAELEQSIKYCKETLGLGLK